MSDRLSSKHWRADATLALVALLWGTTFVVVKGALTEITTFYFLTLRFSLAAAAMFPLLVNSVRTVGYRTTWHGIRAGIVVGAFLTVGYALQTLGLLYTSAGNSGFLTGLYIVLVPLLSAAVYRRWPRWPELAGVAIAGFGMILLTLPGIRNGMHFNRGDLLTIACAVAFAAHLLVLGYYSKRFRFEALAFGQIACVACISALALLFEPPAVRWSRSLVAAIAITGLLATAAAFVLQTWAQRYTSATRVALIFSLEPVFALVTAVAAAGEKVTWFGVCGGALILSGILLVELKGQN